MSSEKIETFWQDATAEDVAGIMKTGEPIPVRVRNEEGDSWRDDAFLQGWINGNWAARGAYWTFCQVYREPSWYTERPDPGPGWRLLEKFPDEPKLGTDECWNPSERKWQQVKNDDGIQEYQAWYRRRIEPVEPKFAVGQMVRVVGPKEKPALHWGKQMDCQIGFTGVIRNDFLCEGGERFYNLEGIGIWCFREDYLEAVEPVENKPVLIRRWVIEIGDEIKLPNGRVLVFNGEGFEVAQ
jgi:hypothetical protein